MTIPPAISESPAPTSSPDAGSSPVQSVTSTPTLPPAESETTDPRIRRTRQLLQQALAQLLQTREFDKLSVQEITDAAGLNRATFYAHYPDKFALLECMVAARFHALLDERGVVFEGGCTSAITGIILGVCDFLTRSVTQPHTDCPSATHLPPHMESAIITVVRNMLLDGVRKHPPAGDHSPELLAATASWAIYGAAREWLRTPNHPPSEAIAPTIQQLVAPILHPSA